MRVYDVVHVSFVVGLGFGSVVVFPIAVSDELRGDVSGLVRRRVRILAFGLQAEHQWMPFLAQRTLYWTLPWIAGISTDLEKEEPFLSSLTLLDQLSKVPVT